MYFGATSTINGGHDVLAPSYLSNVFYFAEGYTRREPGVSFDTYLCLLNPNDEAAGVKVTYSFPDAAPREDRVDVAPARERPSR